MSDEQSIRDELSVLSYEHPDGYRAHLHSKAIDAILASPAIRRIQAEAWDEGSDHGYNYRLGEEYGSLDEEDRRGNPYRAAKGEQK